MARLKVTDTEIAERDQHWHVSRNIPVAFIVSMLLFFLAQTGTAAWWGARLDSRVDVLEKAQVLIAPQGERLTRVEEKLEGVKSGIADIKYILTAQDTRERIKAR